MTSVTPLVDRRSNRRYSLETALRYRAADGARHAAWKHGSVVNMSASGIFIQIADSLAVGAKWDLVMDWTGLYHGRQAMRLFLSAAVLRSGPQGTAMRILRHRFHDASPTRVRVPRADKNLAVA
jgi:hypothetical protein